MSTTTNDASPPATEDTEPVETVQEPRNDRDAVDAGADDHPESDLPLDQVFELLKNQRRRNVLQYLKNAEDQPVSIGELAEHIAAIENDTTVKAISSSQRKRVYVALYQCHLPKMDDCDVVEFDQNRGQISLDRNAVQLEEFLDSGEDDRPWSRYYLGLSTGGAVLFALSVLGGTPFGLTPALVLGALVLSVASCAVCNEYVERSEGAPV